VPLPAPVDPDGIDAVYRQGVLTIRLAKYEAVAGPGASA
jgi:HSP20 family molecular chaperone IbpA